MNIVRGPAWGKQYTFETVEDRDSVKNPKEDVVYVDRLNYRCDFKCPCGCGDWITLNLLAEANPCWSIILNTISPSIQRTVGCKCHFFITNGFITKQQINRRLK